MLSKPKRSVTNIKLGRVASKNKKLHLSDELALTPLQKAGIGLKYLTLITIAIIILGPILSLVFAAFNNNANNFISFNNYQFGAKAFVLLFRNTPFVNWLLNSIIVALITMALSVIIVSFTGFAYSRFRFKGKRVSLIVILIIQMIPTTAALLAFYILNSILNQSFGLLPYFTLIFIYSGGAIASNTFVLKNYLDSISSDIDDAARIEGLNNIKLYWKIIVPLAKPMLAVIAMWSFIGPFGDIILPQLLFYDQAQLTLAAGLNTLITENSNHEIFQPEYAAGSIITSIPIVLLFLFMQRYLVMGLTSGGVKG